MFLTFSPLKKFLDRLSLLPGGISYSLPLSIAYSYPQHFKSFDAKPERRFKIRRFATPPLT
jgi:hypothetical protein